MGPMQSTFAAVKEVFRNKVNWVWFIVVAFALYSLNVIIMNYGNIISLYGNVSFSGYLFLLLKIFINFPLTIYLTSAISIILISLLTALLVVLLVYRAKQKMIGGKMGVIGSLGVFLGIIAPGCASCCIGLAAVLGLASSLFSLPLKGIEISIVAVLLLGYATVKTSKSIYSACEIPVLNNERRRKK